MFDQDSVVSLGNYDTEYNTGSTPTKLVSCTKFFPETNFKKYATEQIRILHDKYDNLARMHQGDQQLEAENSSKEGSVESF